MPAKNQYGLTPKEEIFAQEKAKGATNVDAYEAAGYNPGANRQTHKNNGSKVAKRPLVMARIKQLQEAVDSQAILSVEQIQASLTEMALDDANSKNVKLKALDQLAKTKGAYSDNVNVHATGALTIEDKEAALKELMGE